MGGLWPQTFPSGSPSIDNVEDPSASTVFAVDKLTRTTPTVEVTSKLEQAPTDGSEVFLANDGTAIQIYETQGTDTLKGVDRIGPGSATKLEYNAGATEWQTKVGPGLDWQEIDPQLFIDAAAAHNGTTVKTIAKDGNYFTGSTGLSIGANGGLAVNLRNTAAATARGWNGFTQVRVPITSVFPEYSQIPQILFLALEPVVAPPVDAVLAFGAREWDDAVGPGEIFAFGLSMRLPTASSLRPDQPLASTYTAGSTFTPSSIANVRVISTMTMFQTPNNVNTIENTNRCFGYDKNTYLAVVGAGANSANVYGSGDPVCFTFGAGDITTTDDGLQACEVKLYAAWAPFPAGMIIV